MRYAPEMYNNIIKFFMTNNPDIYKDINSISFDYAVVEKSNNVVMLPVDFTWSDIGNLDTLLNLKKRITNL